MKISAFLMMEVVILGLADPGYSQIPVSIVCHFERCAIAERGQGDTLSTTVELSDYVVTIGNLNTAEPVLTGNMGSTHLTVLRKDGTTCWLAEYPPLGGMNVLTLFFDEGIVLYSKQYRLTGPFGMISIGRFRPKK